MPKIEIQVARLDEAEILKSHAINAFEENYKKYGHYPPGLESVNWHKEKIKNGIYYTIRFKKEIAGGLFMILYPGNQMKIEYLFLDPEFQGNKIGSTVLALIENKYKEITNWFLLTPYKDFKNHYFYEKLGYEKVGEIKPIVNSEFTLFQYEKIINP